MDWGSVAGWSAVCIAFLAINASTIQFLLKRREDQRQRDSGHVDEVEKNLIELRVNLPLEYVRREDWIRFGGTLDAKLDSMRDEMRGEIIEVKGCMPEGIDLEQKRREEARWRMMRVIDAGRPIAVSEQIIWRVLADIKLSPSLITVRRELAYLRDLGLLELEGEEGEIWFAKLTAAGVDVVEYNHASPAGIARPHKYW